MLRNILLKLPGLAAISDASTSPCQGRFVRSISPVRSLSPLRKEYQRHRKIDKIRKRSLSFPACKPKSYDNLDTYLWRWPDVTDRKVERIVQRRDLHNKNKVTKKGVNPESHQIRCFSADEMRSSHKGNRIDEEVSKRHNDELEMFEITDQYELEAAKPRGSRSELTFNVFDYMDRLSNQHDASEYLQPSNLKPFGSMDNPYNPTIIAHTSNLSQLNRSISKIQFGRPTKIEKDTEDHQRRAYSTKMSPKLNQTSTFLTDNITVSGVDNLGTAKEKSPDNEEPSTKSIKSHKNIRRRKKLNVGDTCKASPVSVDPPHFLCNKEMNNAEIFPEKKYSKIIDEHRLTPPWPAYSDTVKEALHSKMSHPSISTDLLTPEDSINNDSPTIKLTRGASVKSPSKDNFAKDKCKVGTKSRIFEPRANNLQKRTISTDPLLSRPPSLQTAQITKNAFSRKARAPNPEDCKPIESKAPKKCFLPSKIRLKPPPCTPRPEYDCPKEELCPPRADDCMEDCGKKLPLLEDKPCPVIQPFIPEQSPKLKRLILKFKDPPRICPPDTPACPPRADDLAPTKKKRLRPLLPNECACIEPPPMVDVPLVRLKKICEPEEKCYPPRICPEPELCVRTDDTLLVDSKPLPPLKDSSCLCVEPFIPTEMPSMRRLKFEFKDTPRECPPQELMSCPPRADDGIEEKPKKLPYLKAKECPCVEPPKMVDVRLKRLPKYSLPEIKKECPIETCEDRVRADDDLKVKSKKLPIIEASDCICISPQIPDKNPTLRRLRMEFKDEPRVCLVAGPVCPPRADDTAPKKKKKLKPYVSGECLCVEPPKMTDVPLMRLIKRCIPEEVCYPKRECPPEEICVRADVDICQTQKRLPKLVAKQCPCIEEEWKDAPKLKRLHFKTEDPPRVKYDECICGVDCPRADDNLIEQPKKLPSIKPGDCPCVETQMTDVKLKRLKCEDYPEDCFTEDPCVDFPRADWGCWEYYTPEQDNKVKTNNKKKGVLQSSQRKYNTDVKSLPQQSHRENLKEDSKTDFRKTLKPSDSNPTLTNKTEFSNDNKFLSPSTPTVKLLNDIEELEKEDAGSVSFDGFSCGKLDTKQVFNKIPMQEYNANIKLSQYNSRHLSTTSLNKKSTSVSKDRSPKDDKLSKKKEYETKTISCKKTTQCPVFSMQNCVPRLTTSCDQERTPVCCQKKLPPYPAFSEVMDEEMEPFSKNTQWVPSKQELVNKEKKPGNSIRNKRSFSTLSFPKGITVKPTDPSNTSQRSGLRLDENGQAGSAQAEGIVGSRQHRSRQVITPSVLNLGRQICESSTSPSISIPTSRDYTTSTKNGDVSDIKVTDKKKKCPKFKLPNCPTARVRDCHLKSHKLECEKLPSPYKSFSDCLDEELMESLSECPMERKKVDALQPRYMDPLDRPNLLESLKPGTEKYDPKKEEDCVREKLCLDKKGLSQDCSTFGKFMKPMKAKDYIKEPKSKDCQKIDELKKIGKWPPKRQFSTATVGLLNFQKRGMCNVANASNNNKESSRYVRSFHALNLRNDNNIAENITKHEQTQSQNQLFISNDSCKLKKLRWGLNNFHKWERMNKLSNMPGMIKRYHTYSKVRCHTHRCVLKQNRSKLYTAADKTDPSVSKCSTKYLSGSNSAKHNSNKKRTSSRSPIDNQRDQCKIKYSQRNEISKLQPRYPILPEMNLSLSPQHPDKIHPLMEVEYMKNKFGLKKGGVTQDCSNFGDKLKISHLVSKSPKSEQSTDADSQEHDLVDKPKRVFNISQHYPTVYCESTRDTKELHDSDCHSDAQIDCAYLTEMNTVGECYDEKRLLSSNNKCGADDLPDRSCGSSKKICDKSQSECESSCEHHTDEGCIRPYIKPGTKYRTVAESCNTKNDFDDDDCCSQQSVTETSSVPANDELTMWRKIVNYFKARPNCPAPDEWKKKALKAKAEKAAKAAGLVLCDPKDLPPNFCTEQELPKVITPECSKTDDGENCCASRCSVRADEKCLAPQKREFSSLSVNDIGDHFSTQRNYINKDTQIAFNNSRSLVLCVHNNVGRSISKRFYSKKVNCVDAEFVEKSTDEKQDEKKLMKKKTVEMRTGKNPKRDEESDAIHKQRPECKEQNFTLGMPRRAADTTHKSDSVELTNYRLKLLHRKPSCLDILFDDSADETTRYYNAKAIAAIQDYFGRVEDTSLDISYEDLDNLKTKKLVNELDKLIIEIESKRKDE